MRDFAILDTKGGGVINFITLVVNFTAKFRLFFNSIRFLHKNVSIQ